MFALRILLADWTGSECWVSLFDESAVHVLGLEMLRGACVPVSIMKSVTREYVNYIVSELEVVAV